MKYCVIDKLDIFEFHDSSFSFVDHKNGDLTVKVKYLNVHKNTEQNSEDDDMEIKCARVTFKGFRAIYYEVGRTWKPNENGEYLPEGEQIIFHGEQAMEKIIVELQNSITVFDFDKVYDYHIIDGSGIEPFFTISFKFDSVVIEWDEYLKRAWYELHKYNRFNINLETPDGDVKTNIEVFVQEDDKYVDGQYLTDQEITVILDNNGKKIAGQGSDYLWMDALADLQRKLPEGVTLKCCLTCRHGNLCPYGNAPGQIFCTKDRDITSKGDMCDLFDTCDTGAFEHEITDCCDDFVHQSDDFYTYNDYLYHLKKALGTEGK